MATVLICSAVLFKLHIRIECHFFVKRIFPRVKVYLKLYWCKCCLLELVKMHLLGDILHHYYWAWRYSVREDSKWKSNRRRQRTICFCILLSSSFIIVRWHLKKIVGFIKSAYSLTFSWKLYILHEINFFRMFEWRFPSASGHIITNKDDLYSHKMVPYIT